MSVPYDYDANPARYRLGVQVTRAALDSGATTVPARIWELLPERADLVVADVGSADGPLAAARPAGSRAWSASTAQPCCWPPTRARLSARMRWPCRWRTGR